MRRGEGWVIEVIEQPELLAQQEGAVEPAVGPLDLAEGGQLAHGLALGGLEQRPAGALHPPAGRGVRALVGVPLVAADLVGRPACEAADVEGIEADLGVRDRLADGALVLAAHVDRDGPDRVPPVAELGEERLQGGAVAAGCAPHDRAGGVVGDARQVALAAAVGDLVDADRDEAVEAPLVEVVGHHALDDAPDRVPGDAQQPGDRRLGHLLGQPAGDVLEVARGWRASSRPRHRLEPDDPAVRAAQPAQLALDHAPVGAEVEVAPALDPAVVDLQLPTALAAPRAGRRRRRTVTITSSAPNATSMTDTPGRRSNRLNAVVTRTSPS